MSDVTFTLDLSKEIEQQQLLQEQQDQEAISFRDLYTCLLYTSPSPRDA